MKVNIDFENKTLEALSDVNAEDFIAMFKKQFPDENSCMIMSGSIVGVDGSKPKVSTGTNNERVESVVILLNEKKLRIDTHNLMRKEDGERYFTPSEARKEAARQGKRLMSPKEQKELFDCPNYWDDELVGRVFEVPTPNGGVAKITLPALGHVDARNTKRYVGVEGRYWFLPLEGKLGVGVIFRSHDMSARAYNKKNPKFTVRCVQDVID